MIYVINDVEAREALEMAEIFSIPDEEICNDYNFDEDYDCTYDVRDDRLY